LIWLDVSPATERSLPHIAADRGRRRYVTEAFSVNGSRVEHVGDPVTKVTVDSTDSCQPRAIALCHPERGGALDAAERRHGKSLAATGGFRASRPRTRRGGQGVSGPPTLGPGGLGSYDLDAQRATRERAWAAQEAKFRRSMRRQDIVLAILVPLSLALIWFEGFLLGRFGPHH